MEIEPVDPGIFIGIGLLALAINFVGCYEVQRIQKGESVKAGLATAINVVLGSVLMYAFINNPLYAIPEALGSFIGNYAMVELDKRKRTKVTTNEKE